VTDAQENKVHSLRQSVGDFKDLQRFSSQAIREDYRQLNSQIHRFMIRMNQRGAFMKMTKFPFNSKHKKLFEQAKDYTFRVKKYIER